MIVFVSRWTYPVLLVLPIADQHGLYSIFNDITGGQIVHPVLTHECHIKIRSDKQIKSLILQIPSASIDDLNRLLGDYSSIEHIESIYLLGKVLEKSEERNAVLNRFHKVCMLCDDEGHLVVRWALNTVNEFRVLAVQHAEAGDNDTSDKYFQRAMKLCDRLAEFIGKQRWNVLSAYSWLFYCVK